MESDDNDKKDRAFFRSSRRVTFVTRSKETAARFSSARASRDNLSETNIEVEEDQPLRPATLGLESDWGQVTKSLASLSEEPACVSLATAQTSEAHFATAILRERIAYIFGTYEGSDRRQPVESIALDRDLFDLVKAQRAGIALDLSGGEPARLVSYKAVADLLASTKDLPVSEPAAKVDEPVSKPEPAPAPPPPEVDRRTRPADGNARLRALTAPRGFPDTLQQRLGEGLKNIGEKFTSAMLFQVEYVDGQTEYLIGFAGVADGQFDKVEDAVNAVLATSRRNSVQLGIAFLENDDPLFDRVSRVGLRIG